MSEMAEMVEHWVNEHIERMRTLVYAELFLKFSEKYADVVDHDMRVRFIDEDILSELVKIRAMMYINQRLYITPSGRKIVMSSVQDIHQTLQNYRDEFGSIPMPESPLTRTKL
jgi:hypothetical protein